MRTLEHEDISFVIPLFNEEEVFDQLIPRINALTERLKGNVEVILVDDGSTDSTPDHMEHLALEDARYHCIFLSRNFGHQNALTAGLDAASGHYVMLLDADLQDPPELLFSFLEKAREGYDVVYGIRKNRKEGALKKFAYKFFYRLLSNISNHKIPLDSGDFCLMSRRVVKAICQNREQSRFLRGFRSWIGFRQIGVAYDRQKRAAGAPKYNLRRLLRLAENGIYSYTNLPLKLLTYSGALIVFLSFIYAGYTLFRKFYFGDVPSGFTAIILVLSISSGFQLLSVGVLGEYLYRTFIQVMQRPLYIVEKKIVNGKKHVE